MKFLLILLSTFGVAAAGAQDYRIEQNEVKIQPLISFRAGTAELEPESKAALTIIKKYLDDKPYISLLRVEAHLDAGAKPETAQALTEKRAAAVCQALIELGVACSRLLPVGFGSTKPVAANDSPEGRSQNRRVTFVNASLRDKPIGGMPVDGGGKVAENPCD